MVVHDAQRENLRVVRGQCLELQDQAFLGAARPDPGRVEILQVAQSDLQFVGIDLEFGRQRFRQILQRLGQVAVVIQRLDQALHQGSVTRRQAHQAELPRQVLAQRRRRRLHVLEIVVVVVERAR